jgi:hypothetical protein
MAIGPGNQVQALAQVGGTGGSSALLEAVPNPFIGALDAIYEVTPTHWYKARPYGFVHQNRFATSLGGIGKFTMYLPIAPENIRVSTPFATNIVTTLYGIVEEHSENRYYDITISGTTGFAPRYTKPGGGTTSPTVSLGTNLGRKAFDNFDLGSFTGGFFQQQVGVLNSVLDNASNVLEDITGVSNDTGIKPEKSGYAAFHNLYRFLMQYKRDTAGEIKLTQLKTRQAHPLQFLNYKDDIKYDVVPISFNLTRNATNPMLYNYNIVMRGFNLRNVTADNEAPDTLALLGLGTTDTPVNQTSFFSSAQSLTGNAANILSVF